LINAVLDVLKTGIAGCDLPFVDGDFNSVRPRDNRWYEQRVWETIASALADEDEEGICVDSTAVRASAGAKKRGRLRRSERAGSRPLSRGDSARKSLPQ
jgi:hypothetical protein